MRVKRSVLACRQPVPGENSAISQDLSTTQPDHGAAERRIILVDDVVTRRTTFLSAQL